MSRGLNNLKDGAGNPIDSHIQADGGYALNIHNADVHNTLINRHFIDFDSATENPSVAITAGDTLITVVSTTGFTVGDPIVIKDAGGDIREHHLEITAIVVDTSITVDRPIDQDYTTSAALELVITNMNVSGSLASPLIYEVAPPLDEIWHITRIIIAIADAGTMDDGKFGSLSTLTNGTVFRENKTALTTITNWHNNGDMAQDMFDVEYTAKAPAGENGLRGRFSNNKNAVVYRLDGANGDKEILIQDDLTDLTSFHMKAQGHIEG